jgi:lipopolysaccharide export system protein LptA
MAKTRFLSWLVAACWLISQHTGLAVVSTLPSNDINIQADQQIFDANTSRTTFKGKVNVRYRDMRINGTQAVVDMSPSGQPQVANFLNRPKAKKISPSGREDILDADIIRIYLTNNAVRAEGNVISYVTSVASDPFTIRSDVQQYDGGTKSVAAVGGVTVNYQDTVANSRKALLQTGPDGKAEKITFLEGARIRKPDGDVNAEKITLTIANNNMVAEKNVVTNSIVKGPYFVRLPAVRQTNRHHAGQRQRRYLLPELCG